jgi:hypothetical protein
MVRKNFYQLLKNLDPKVNDTEIISEAIENQLNIWQSNRSKGNSERWEKLLALEDKMKQVMLNTQSRQKEAQDFEDIKWVEEFAKDFIVKPLTEYGLSSIYDFLSQDSDGKVSGESYEPDTSMTVLNERISILTDEFRQKPNNAPKQELIGKCSAILEDKESKRRYDNYIIRKVTEEIEDDVNKDQAGKVLDNSDFQRIRKRYTKSWFSAPRVSEVIYSFCEENKITVSVPKTYVPPDEQRKQSEGQSPHEKQHAKQQKDEPQDEQRLDSIKSRKTAGLLGVFFGPLGVHNFYLGKIGRGIAQFLLSFILIGILWGYAEGVFILSGMGCTDGKGRKLKGRRHPLATFGIASMIHLCFCAIMYVLLNFGGLL